MHNLRFCNRNRRLKILCLGAHADDIEIGCGGTVLRLLNDFPMSQFRWVVFSGDGKRSKEAQQSGNVFLKGAESKLITIQNFRESYFPFFGAGIKDFFGKLEKEFSPDLIFTHYAKDAHQDHRLLSDLTWNAFRDHLILEYEMEKELDEKMKKIKIEDIELKVCSNCRKKSFHLNNNCVKC